MMVDLTVLPSKALPADHPDVDALGMAMVHALSSLDFQGLPVSRQVSWILHCFQTAVTRYLKELAIIRSLAQFHSGRLYENPNLTLADACILTESISGLNWGDAASLFDMRGYDRYGVQPFRRYVRSHTATPICERKAIVPKAKQKIVYFSHYAYTNSTKSLANPLGPFIRDIVLSHSRLGTAEIICYCVQWWDQTYVDVLEKCGVTVRIIPQELAFSRLEELRLAILGDAPDVVISDVPSPIASWLFIHRIAPLQIYLDPGYPHWNLPELDWVLLPGKVYQRGFELPSNRSSSMRIALSDETVNTAPVSVLAHKKTNHSVRFGAFTRLIKITDAWVSAVEDILQLLPKTTLLIVGAGNPALIRRLIDNPTYSGRVSLINEMVDLKEYQDRIDVLLDTFPFIGGLVCREFMGYGVPVVSVLSGEWDEMLRDQRDPELLAPSTDEFVALAVRLATESKFYSDATETSKRLAIKQNKPEDMIRDIENGIESAMSYFKL